MLDLPAVSCGTFNEAESDFVAMRNEVDIEFLLYVRDPFDTNRVLDVESGCNELAMPGELGNDT